MRESTIFPMAFIFYIASALLYLAYLYSKRESPAKTGSVVALFGLLLHTLALILRTFQSGHAPFTNMYESLSFLAWATILAYLIIEWKFKVRKPGAYLLLFAGGVMAPKSSRTAERLDSISYRAISVGFPLFTLGGLVFGMVWAYKAWGTYWSWDPKEVWSLITWFVFALYLHTRIVMGWKGRRSVAIAIIGFLAALFTYFGVNYLLAGLHSYA